MKTPVRSRLLVLLALGHACISGNGQPQSSRLLSSAASITGGPSIQLQQVMVTATMPTDAFAIGICSQQGICCLDSSKTQR